MATLSARIRAVQDQLTATAHELTVILADATYIGLAPFRLAEIRFAIHDTRYAASQLDGIIHALTVGDPIGTL